jgi:putative tryptophan/tyrosine transport system substrate-binding protein
LACDYGHRNTLSLEGYRANLSPLQQSTKFALTFTLKAAKQIGVTIPPNVLARADKVIK